MGMEHKKLEEHKKDVKSEEKMQDRKEEWKEPGLGKFWNGSEKP